MAKSFHEFSPRAQLIVFVLLTVLMLGASWQVLIGPQQTDLAARRVQVAALETDLSRAQAVAARLPKAQREVKALEASLRETEAVIPEEKDPQDVLRNLHELASESLLEIATFKPRVAVAKAQYTEWPIELGIEGSYHDLGRFFDRIATMQRLMSVSDLQIKTKSKPNGRGTVSVSCVATTFVFKKDLASTSGVQP
ncbi:MAG: type 4a pilus biogenesis protein PilO [Vicinamibacterales bacterium]